MASSGIRAGGVSRLKTSLWPLLRVRSTLEAVTDLTKLDAANAALQKQATMARTTKAFSQAQTDVSHDFDARLTKLETAPPPVVEPPPASWDWAAATHHYYDFDPGTKISGCKNRFNENDGDNWWVPGGAEPPTPPLKNWSDNGGIHPFSDPVVGPGFKLRVSGEMGYYGTGPKGAYPYDSRTCSFKDVSPSYFARGNLYRFEWAWRWLSANNPHGWPAAYTREGFITACNVNGAANVSHHCYLEGSGTTPYFRAALNTSHNVWDMKYSNAAGIQFLADKWYKMRFDLKVNRAGVNDGYLRVSTDKGDGWEEWARWDNVQTYPSNFAMPYGVWWSLRLPNQDDGWAWNTEYDTAAARVTVNPAGVFGA